MEMRIYNPDVRAPDDDIRGLLANYKAVLTAFGFKMEVTTKLMQGSTYQKTYFFFKTVKCSQVPDVNKEIDSLIKGNTTNEHLTRGLGITLIYSPGACFSKMLIAFWARFIFAVFAFTIQKFQIILKRAIQ